MILPYPAKIPSMIRPWRDRVPKRGAIGGGAPHSPARIGRVSLAIAGKPTVGSASRGQATDKGILPPFFGAQRNISIQYLNRHAHDVWIFRELAADATEAKDRYDVLGSRCLIKSNVLRAEHPFACRRRRKDGC